MGRAAAAVGAVLLLDPCSGVNEATAVSHTVTTQPLADTELSCARFGCPRIHIVPALGTVDESFSKEAE
eukprot:COSAG06_NODE_47407_length_339_cov_0.950000_1_plen_68_part_01